MIFDDNKTLYDLVSLLLISSIKGFREVLPHMTVVLNQAIEVDHESDAREAFDVFENLLIVVCSHMTTNPGIILDIQESP